MEYASVLPPPAFIEHYERTLPGSADRIFTMAESQGKHRMGLESRVIEADIGSARLGTWLGFCLSVLIIGVAGFLIYQGKDTLGLGLIGADVTALIAVFVTGSVIRSNERKQKRAVSQPR